MRADPDEGLTNPVSRAGVNEAVIGWKCGPGVRLTSGQNTAPGGHYEVRRFGLRTAICSGEYSSNGRANGRALLKVVCRVSVCVRRRERRRERRGGSREISVWPRAGIGSAFRWIGEGKWFACRSTRTGRITTWRRADENGRSPICTRTWPTPPFSSMSSRQSVSLLLCRLVLLRFNAVVGKPILVSLRGDWVLGGAVVGMGKGTMVL